MVVSQPPRPSRPHAIARCAFCDWSLHYTDDTVVAVATFLRAALLGHVAEAHPDETAAAGPHARIGVKR